MPLYFMHFIVIPDKHMQFFCLIFLKDVEKWVQQIKTIKKKKSESFTGTKALNAMPLTTNTEVIAMVRKRHPEKKISAIP